jgi:hypothetical protein
MAQKEAAKKSFLFISLENRMLALEVAFLWPAPTH